MGHLRLSDHIEAPIDHVWDIRVSCERLPEWNVSIVEVEDCPGRLDWVGAKVRTVTRLLGRRIHGIQETTTADAPHKYAVIVRGPGGSKATVEVSYVEVRGGTDTTFDVEYDLPLGLFSGVAEKLLRGTVERDLRHSMENFKALCEATVPARTTAQVSTAPSGSASR